MPPLEPPLRLGAWRPRSLPLSGHGASFARDRSRGTGAACATAATSSCKRAATCAPAAPESQDRSGNNRTRELARIGQTECARASPREGILSEHQNTAPLGPWGETTTDERGCFPPGSSRAPGRPPPLRAHRAPCPPGRLWAAPRGAWAKSVPTRNESEPRCFELEAGSNRGCSNSTGVPARRQSFDGL